MAAITYIVTIFLTLHAFNLIIQLMKYGGLQGWNAPMQSLNNLYSNYSSSPFAWEVWQFYAAMLSVQFFGSIALAILVLLVSILAKNAFVTFFLSGMILGIPYVLNQFGSEIQWVQYISSFSYMETIRIERLFATFNAYNVFGQPILYPVLQIILYTILSVCFIWLIYRVFHKHQVNN